MVARPNVPFRSANAGELSPDAKGRIDIKQYYSAGLAYKNIEPVPQGGFRRMHGTRRRGRARSALASIPATGSLSAGPHNAGTATLITRTFSGGATSVSAVLVDTIQLNASTAVYWVEAETSTGVWTQMGGTFSASTTAESRVAAFPPGLARSALAVRLRATFAGTATVSLTALTAHTETGARLKPRYVAISTDDGLHLSGFVSAGICDFFDANGHIGAAWLPAITEPMLPDLGFYSEAATIGIFHPGTQRSQRIRLTSAGNGRDWATDDWPYEVVPVADLGGAYAMTDDRWEIFIRWTGTVELYIQVTVEGQSTEAIPHTSDGTTVIASGSFNGTTWGVFATSVQTAIRALPGMTTGVTVTAQAAGTGTYKLIVTFGGDLSGEEFDVQATIVNTASASSLVYHTQVGEVDLPDLFSDTAGWPGSAVLVQDRMMMMRHPEIPGAIAMSRTGEYFDLDISAVDAAGPRLDRIRSQTSETVLYAKESTYLVVFTDRGVYFNTNRTIDRNTPPNFLNASETGMQANTLPIDLEGQIYYVADGGNQLVSIAYDEVSSRFNASPESLLATHLMTGVMRSVRQRSDGDLDAARGWLMRSDGRLVCVQMIRNQEIIGFCEWVPADSGAVREIGIDGANRLWKTVERGSDITIELADRATFLQDTVEVTPDLAGGVTGLPYADGTVVWAVAEGYVVGPMTCQSGAVDLGDPYASATVGRWVAPRFESMPQVYVTPAEDVVFRPGRIHTCMMNVIDTTSVAVGANGSTPRDVPLARIGDPADQPLPARNELVTVDGIKGFAIGPTLVITQLSPGELRVRDFAIGAKL